MKCAVLFVIFLGASAGVHTATKWQLWKRVHQRNYSVAEDARRFTFFKKNVADIARLNAIHARGTARFGLNKYADWSASELTSLRGTHIPLDARAGVSVEKSPLSMPTTVDWRTRGVVSPIQDQGQCGSCWAFSATANMESQWAIAKGVSPPPKLSEQFLVDCDHQCGNYRGEDGCDQGCEGGLMPNAFRYVMTNGDPSESAYPYSGADGSCQSGLRPIVTVKNWTLLSQDEDQIATWVAANGPASVAVDASEWSFYVGGVMEYLCWGRTTIDDLDHGVVIVGYGVDGGTSYWLIRNSWGTSWGEDGYARIIRGSGFCGVNLFACSSIV